MRINRIFLFVLTLTLLCSGCQRAVAAEPTSTDDFIGSLTFLGDSITAHMAQRADVSPSQIWAARERYLNLDSRITYAKIVAPDTGEEETIAAVAARLQPRYLVLTLGIDYGVYYYRNDLSVFALYYEKLLDALHAASPDTRILIQSILPVSENCKGVTNTMIDNANAVLCEIAERRGLLYLDTQSVLRDENGFLREEYCYSADGIHLTESAYDAVLGYIATYAEKAGWGV